MRTTLLAALLLTLYRPVILTAPRCAARNAWWVYVVQTDARKVMQ